MDIKVITGTAIALSVVAVSATYIYSKVDEIKTRKEALSAYRQMRALRASNGGITTDLPVKKPDSTSNT